MKLSIEIPVTRLTKKCLQASYGEGVINVPVRSSLFQNLSKSTFSNNENVRAKRYCTEVIQLNVSKELKDIIEKTNIWSLGYMLHGYEIDLMLNTIEFCVFHLKNEAMRSIENYFAARKVDEDDFAISTAYKSWQRRQANKIGKHEEFRRTKTHKKVFNCSSLPCAEIIKHLTVLYDTDFHKFRGPRLNEQIYHERRKVILFLCYKLSTITIRDLAKEFLFNFPNLHKNIKTTEFIYNNFEEDNLSIMINVAFAFLQHKVSPLNIAPLRLLLKHDDK